MGNVPMEWYKEFDHIGYDLDGKRIGKPEGGDDIDEFLEKMDNPNYWYVIVCIRVYIFRKQNPILSET